MPCPEKFNESLEIFKLEKSVIDEINDGYDGIVSAAPKPVKAAYFKRSVDIMEKKLEPEKVKEILEYNGCCKSGARKKTAKAFAKENASLSLDERLPKIEAVPYMGNPVLSEDGTITLHAVYYRVGEKFSCACPNYNKVKRDYPVSKTYCYCCAGHFLHHYEIMLGCKLGAEIISSPLDTDGAKPCVMKLTVIK